MKKIPNNKIAYKKTPIFTQENVPKGLINKHQTIDNVWAKIIVLEGELVYTILEPSIIKYKLSVGVFGIIEPCIFHQVKLLENTRFYIEFYK